MSRFPVDAVKRRRDGWLSYGRPWCRCAYCDGPMSFFQSLAALRIVRLEPFQEYAHRTCVRRRLREMDELEADRAYEAACELGREGDENGE